MYESFPKKVKNATATAKRCTLSHAMRHSEDRKTEPYAGTPRTLDPAGQRLPTRANHRTVVQHLTFWFVRPNTRAR